MKRRILLLLIVSLSINAFGQERKKLDVSKYDATPQFIEMMQDGSYNFYDVKKAYEDYMTTHPDDPRSFNQYKRWAYFMEERTYPNGNLPKSMHVWNEMTQYKKKQKPQLKSSGNWVELGPNTMGTDYGHWNPGVGRINAIVKDPNNSNVLYIGAPAGGLWRTVDDGNTWTPLTDHLSIIGVSGIVVDHTNSNTIYIATGDKDANDTHSIGVLKSTDYGVTWNNTGLVGDQDINRLIMHPTNNNILFAGKADGLYKTTNGGTSWTNVLNGDVDDIELKPGDPNTVYAITESFYRSTDGGNTFSSVSISTSGRAQIAVTEANSNYVYFVSASGVFRSTNSGSSFTKRGNYPGSGGQIWYDLACAASHTNAEELHVGEVESFVSTNGGTSFTKTSNWYFPQVTIDKYVHADIHEMIFYGNTLYVGSDGLITRSNDAGNSWTNLTNGIGIRQFYRIGGSKTSENIIGGGAQDNGTSIYNNGTWYDWLGADGFEFVVDYNNNNTIYGTSQNGNFYKSTNGGSSQVNIANPVGGAWLTPYVIDPVNSSTLYAGTSQIRKTTNGMSSWTTIGTFGSGNVNAIAVAESNNNYLYASKGANLWRTNNGGGSWTQINSGLPNLAITYITVHPSNPEIVAVSFSGYTSGSKVFISYDAGTAWTNYSSNLPNIPANCVTFYDSPDNELYVGMDVGVYYRNKNLAEWVDYTNGLPNVIVKELEIFYPTNTLRVGTYGRGLWVGDLYTSAPQAPVAEFTASSTSLSGGQSVTFTDQSTNTPTSWSWTFNGGTPTSSSVQNPVVTYNTAGTYSVSLTATNAQGNDIETKTNYITVTDAPLTYCTSQGNNWSYLWIGGVSVGTFNNTSGATGYTDFTSQVISMVEGNNSVSLTPEYPSGSQYNVGWNVWIDLNKDGDFADSGEDMFTSSIGTSVANGTITIPSSFSGQTRMRVSMKYNATPTSCETFTYGEVEDYTINVTVSTEPPVANFTASATTINAGQNVTFTDQSTNAPASWSWTFIGGTPSTGSSQNHVITYNTAGTYIVSLTATNSYGKDTETKTAYITVTEPAVTYCASQGNNSTYEWISAVTIGAFNNTSGAANYTDFTSQIISLISGNSYDVTLTPDFSNSTYTEYWKIWIDFNGNGDFTDAGEEFNIGNGTSTVNGNITIPASATGQTRLRISMKYDALQTSCETFAYGEVEDYTISFIVSPVQPDYSIDFVAEESVNLFPNPSTGNVRLTQDTNVKGKITIQVYNLEGKIVHQLELFKSENGIETDLELQDLQSGIYYIFISSTGKSYSKKFIISK